MSNICGLQISLFCISTVARLISPPLLNSTHDFFLIVFYAHRNSFLLYVYGLFTSKSLGIHVRHRMCEVNFFSHFGVSAIYLDSSERWCLSTPLVIYQLLCQSFRLIFAQNKLPSLLSRKAARSWSMLDIVWSQRTMYTIFITVFLFIQQFLRFLPCPGHVECRLRKKN